MDVFVHASLRDGMPNALLEAMACGKPVVVTPVGGMAEVVEDRANGLVVPVDDADALRRAIETLLDDASLRENLAANARRDVIEKCSAEKELTANLAIYQQLCDPSPARNVDIDHNLSQNSVAGTLTNNKPAFRAC